MGTVAIGKNAISSAIEIPGVFLDLLGEGGCLINVIVSL
jgi:hypothetical protein